MGINGDELTDLKESDAAEVEAMQLSRAAAAKRSAAERKKRYAKIDRICLATFPLLFLTFNCCYWLAYTTRCQVGGRLCDQNWTRLISELSTVFMDRKNWSVSRSRCRIGEKSRRRSLVGLKWLNFQNIQHFVLRQPLACVDFISELFSKRKFDLAA